MCVCAAIVIMRSVHISGAVLGGGRVINNRHTHIDIYMAHRLLERVSFELGVLLPINSVRRLIANLLVPGQDLEVLGLRPRH